MRRPVKFECRKETQRHNKCVRLIILRCVQRIGQVNEHIFTAFASVAAVHVWQTQTIDP